MKKKGFTLAEVLITLGIVGVIAALTTPTLIASTKNQSNAAKLSKTVSTVENALGAMVANEGVDSIDETAAWAVLDSASEFTDELNNYLPGSYNDSDSFYDEGTTIKFLSGTAATGNDIPDAEGRMIYVLKNGAVLFLDPTELPELTETNMNILNAGSIYVDVNGTEAPNMWGRDIFAYKIATNGQLWPWGGMDVARTSSVGPGGATPSKDRLPTWDNSSITTLSCLPGNNGRGCAGRLAEEGYKMNY